MVQQSSSNNLIQKYYGTAVSLVIYIATGLFLGEKLALALDSMGSMITVIIIFYLVFLLSVLLNLVIHEGGHLVFGLLSGYQFQSFRVGSFMLLRVDGHLKIKKFSLAGTAGQCILSLGETRKYFMYNLGGVLMNLLTCIPLLFLANSGLVSDLISFILYTFSAVGIALALTNGIPLRIGAVDNDGMNILTIHNSKSCEEAFYQSLIIQDQAAKGNSLTKIEDSLFVYDDSKLNLPIVSYLPYTLSQKRLYEGNIEEWKKLDERMNQKDVQLGVNGNLLKNDENYVAYLEGRPIHVSKNLKKFNESMKNYPGVIRANYVQALSEGKDPSKYKEQLISLRSNYPYTGEIEDELSLIERLENNK